MKFWRKPNRVEWRKMRIEKGLEWNEQESKIGLIA